MSQKKIELTPLIDTSTGIFCHLLRFDNTKIIINCGISKDFNYSVYTPIRKIVEEADCILLTSYDISHIGAVGLFPNQLIYCSIPTAILGKIILDELKQQIGNKVLDFFVPRQVKFSQPFRINDLDIISYNSGYIIGNSAFKISKDSETIVICYNFNHRKENFLDGLNIQAIENPDLFITNVQYVNIPPYSLKSRDEKLIESVFNNTGTIIISVPFTRFFELLGCFYKHKLTVVSRGLKLLVERVKSMVEWAGSKSADLLPLLEVEHCKVGDLTDQKIIVSVDEVSGEGYLGAILDKFSGKEHSLLIVSQEAKVIDFSEIKVYEYTYRKKEIIPEIQIEEIDNPEDNEEELSHWSKQSKTFFVHGFLNRKDFFPYKKRKKQNNDYGDKVLFQFEKKIDEVELKPNKALEVEEIEERRLIKKGLKPPSNIEYINLYGISDFLSCRTIFEGINPKKIIFVNGDTKSSILISSLMLNNPLNIEPLICDKLISFNTEAVIQKVILSEKAMENKLKKLGDKSITQFRAEKRDNFIECLGKCEPVLIGNLNQALLKKALIEKGFQVETDKNKLTVNDSLKIDIENNNFVIESDDNELLIAVREIFYRFVAMI